MYKEAERPIEVWRTQVMDGPTWTALSEPCRNRLFFASGKGGEHLTLDIIQPDSYTKIRLFRSGRFEVSVDGKSFGQGGNRYRFVFRYDSLLSTPFGYPTEDKEMALQGYNHEQLLGEMFLKLPDSYVDGRPIAEAFFRYVDDLKWDVGVFRDRRSLTELHLPASSGLITEQARVAKLEWPPLPIIQAQPTILAGIIDNFKICFPVNGKWVYGQGLSWTRYDGDASVPISLLTNRQHARFWNEKDVPTGLKLSKEGFIKLWAQKSRKWQDHMARAIGLSHAAAAELVRATKVNEAKPHLVPMEEAKEAPRQQLVPRRSTFVDSHEKGVEVDPLRLPTEEGRCFELLFNNQVTPAIFDKKPLLRDVLAVFKENVCTMDSLEISHSDRCVHIVTGETFRNYKEIKAVLEVIVWNDPNILVGAEEGSIADYVKAGKHFLFENHQWVRNGLKLAKGLAEPGQLAKDNTNPSTPKPIETTDYIHPFDNGQPLPGRSDQWVSGFEVTRLRHHEEMPHIRNVRNTGIHGLPGDFLSNYPRLPTPVFHRLRDLWYDVIGVLMKLEFGDNRSPVLNVTANADWVRSETTVNFISDQPGKARSRPREDGGFDILVPCRGIATRSIRLLPLFIRLPPRFKAVALLNGRQSDYDNYGWPVFNPVIPLPQIDSFYVEAVAAGRSMYPPGFLLARYDALDFLVHTATVYGAEEAFLLPFTHHARVYPPPRPGREIAFGSWCKNYEFTAERYWYDADWKLRVHETNHNFDRLIEITKTCRRNPPEENLQARLKDTAREVCSIWQYNIMIASSVAFLIPLFYTLYVPYLQFYLHVDPGDYILLPPVLWLVWTNLCYGYACDAWCRLFFFVEEAGKKELVHSSEEFSSDPSSTLLIPTMGTRGDHVPPRFFANMAVLAGVKTHLLKLQTATYGDLENLKKGKLGSLLPGYLQNHYSVLRGYKAVFTPHVELDMPNATSYNLAPPRSYINKIRYLTDENRSGASIVDRAVTWFAEELADAFWPDWQIGCLRGCNLPRSADGVSLITKQPNLKTGKIGWLHGSADPAVVPKDIRDRYPLVPNGDHNEIFRHYDKIYMPGGAGAVQTAIACGCEVVVTDVNLDRDYHTMPTQKDFHQPSILPYFAWLWRQGFDVKLPRVLLVVGWLKFHYSIRYKHLEFAADFVIRAGLFWWYGCLHLLPFMAAAIMAPRFVKKYLVGMAWLTEPGLLMLKALWRFPIFMVTPRWMLPFIVTVSAYNWWWPLSQDGLNYASKRFELIFEPVARGKYTFSYPFGHWCLRDTNSMIIYEGKFVDPSETSIGSPFKLSKSVRPVRPGAVFHLVPFHIQKLLDSMDEEPLPYSANHNCTTVILKGIMYRSALGFVFAYAVSWAVYLVLRPPQAAATVYHWMYPERSWDTSRLYHLLLGFAAGGTVPMEVIDEEPIEEKPSDVGRSEPIPDNDKQKESDYDQEWWGSQDSIDTVSNDLCYLLSFLKDTAIPEEVKLDVVELAYTQFVRDEKGRIPEPKGTRILVMPNWKPDNWARLIDETHRVLSQFTHYTPRVLSELVVWLKGLGENLYRVAEPILMLLVRAMRAAKSVSDRATRSIYHCLCHWLDVMYGGSAPARVKTVWGLTGLITSGMTSQKAILAQNIAMMEYQGRGNFLDDYDNFVSNIKEPGKGLPGINTIGGPQRRPIRYKNPVMSHQAAEICGLKPGEYEVDEKYQERINDYLAEGIPQAVDGVLFGDRNPDRIARSINRYEPEYSGCSPEDKALVEDTARAMFEQWPEVFADRDIMLPKGVELYIKEKYSAGTPFISSFYKSRKALKQAGVMDVIRKNALECIKTGKYPTQFYHAFAKSQAVPGQPLLAPRMKDLRTVVSQDLSAYMVDQIFQIEANKRITWETYGAGSGMPLSQSMARIWDELHDLRKREGGQFIIADATAYDSNCKPALFHGAGKLVELGFQNHPSGKGRQFAQVVQCKFEAMQNAWVMGITEPSYSALTFHVPDAEVRRDLESKFPKHFVTFSELLEHNNMNVTEWKRLTWEEQKACARDMQSVPGKVFLTNDPALRLQGSSWQGSFTTEPRRDEFRKYQTYFCNSKEAMKEDIKRIVFANREVISNVHHKNRGGGTGQSATSWDNTATFKLGVISAWARATGKPPKDFFCSNRLYNTSDDTVWWSKDLLSSAEVDRFKQAAADFGILLEIGSTKKITEVEYLSKLPRRPTAEDSADYRAWRQGRIENMRSSGRFTEEQMLSIEREQLPQFLMVQNPTAILMRRTAFRYYQSSPSKFLYTSCERGAGHALVTAFQPALYKRFAIEYAEDLNRLCKEHHINQRYELVSQQDRIKMQVINVNPNWKQGFRSSPRQEAFLRWIRQAKFPSYRQVLDIHLRTKDPDPSAHDRFIAKLDRAWRNPDEGIRDMVDGVYRYTDLIPEEFKRFMPSTDMLYAENPWHTHNQYVEKFIYLKLLETTTVDELTFAQFDAVAKESPYGICMNTIKFWEDLRDPDYLKDLLASEAMIDKVRIYQGMTVIISAMYFAMHWVELFVQSLFLIGPLYNLFMWSFWGLSKVYGLANTFYWHGKARSSREISSIMPRDPYMWSKRFVSTMADFIPERFALGLVPATLILDGLAEIIEVLFGRMWRMLANLKSVGTDFGEARSGKSLNVPSNPWAAYAHTYATKAIEHGHVTVAAKTASGKSTFFPAAVWAERRNIGVKKLWIVMPRKILRDSWEIPFDIRSQVVKRGKTLDPTADIYITTYGHFRTRIGGLVPRDNLVFFDEFHEMDGFMLQDVEEWKGPTIFMSATPVALHGMADIPFLEPTLPKRFNLTVYKVDSDDVLEMWNRARNQFADQPALLARPMIIVPTYNELKKTIAGLENLDRSVTWHEVSSNSPLVPKTGGLVCTPYVQTGIDIKPAPSILIDSGRDVVVHKGRLITPHPYTDEKTNEQRVNRVGRTMDGVVIQPQLAGTGDPPVKYPSGIFFSSRLVAGQYRVPRLTEVDGCVHPELPYISIKYTSELSNPEEAKKEEQNVKKSLLFIHLMALAGVRQSEWALRYNRYFELHLPFGEDEDHLQRILEQGKLRYAHHIPVDMAMQLLGNGHVTWGIGGVPTITRPRYPCDGMWVEDPSSRKSYAHKVLLHQREHAEIGMWQAQVNELKAQKLALQSQLRSVCTRRSTASRILRRIRPPDIPVCG
uniref:ORF B n=1 Tax=Cryphonectria hypovirus 1 TaxID=40281 RepID=A0A2H4UK69_9VIRU|nr:ORF B [Cryphonectria hypovirus 1]